MGEHSLYFANGAHGKTGAVLPHIGGKTCLIPRHEQSLRIARSTGCRSITLTDEAAGLRIQVFNRRGAEPVSIARRGADGKWTGYLLS